MSRKAPGKAYWDMNTAELRKATAKYDREFIADEFGPPPAEALAQWERAKRKRGRPRQGKGATVISLSIERGLLRKADSLAKRKGLSRAQLVALGLKSMLAEAG